MNNGIDPEAPQTNRVSTRVRTATLSSYGKGPVVAGGIVAVVLVPLLILGGIGAVSAMTASGSASQSRPVATPTAAPTEAPPTAVPSTAGTDDPVTPPDRDSDQPEVIQHEDTIYYIQDGDTLTTLSAKFGMSIDYIADYNAVRDVNVISAGAVLRVPFIYVPPVV
jgi:LysM repeat protein